MRMVQSVICSEFGGIDKIEVKEIILEDLRDNDLEIEVHYCGLNFADLYTRLGLFPKEEKSFILGIECSGIVRNVGKLVTDFKVNDRVACYNYLGGLHRTTIIISSNNCYLIPDSISLKTASAVFVAFLTAHCCLFEIGHLSRGENIFVHSCAGSVGSAIVQLAKTIPQVKIWGTTSDPNKIVPNSINHVLSYEKYLEDIPPGTIDIFIDNQAHKKYTDNLKLLKPFGKIIVIGANYMVENERLNIGHSTPVDVLSNLILDSVSVSGLHLGEVARRAPQCLVKALHHIWELLSTKQIKENIDSVWNFHTDDIRCATELLQNRRNKGKVLIKTHHVLNTE